MRLHRVHFPELASTNSWCKEHLEGLDSGALNLVTCTQQNAGRGRRGRRWLAASGQNLFASFAWFEEELPAYTANVGQVLALSTSTVLDESAVSIKWPNDLLLNGKKFGGILCETVVSKPCLLVAGIGLNLNSESLPALNREITSTQIELGRCIDLEELCTRLHKQFAQDLLRLQDAGFAPFLDCYRRQLSGAGDHGRLVEVLADGAVVLETAAGLETFREAP